MKKNDRNVAMLAIVLLAGVFLFSSGFFRYSIYPQVQTLPIGSCIAYGTEVWQISGATIPTRNVVPVTLIGWTDGISTGKMIGASDSFTATDANNFMPILCSKALTQPPAPTTGQVTGGGTQCPIAAMQCQFGVITDANGCFKGCVQQDNGTFWSNNMSLVIALLITAIIIIGAVLYRRSYK
jgi:hypothetical protein